MPWNQLFAPDEEYLRVAVTRLLPAYYGMPPDETLGGVLRRMADAFITRHQDRWLLDATRTPRARLAAEAFRALGQAQEAGDAGQIEREKEEAEKATRLFRSAGSHAGVLRAEFERLDALRRAEKPCSTAGQSLEHDLNGTSYSWLRAQTLMVSTICEFRDVNFERTWTKCRAAIKLAKRHSYSVLLLRASGLSAASQRAVGNTAEAWRNCMQGLDSYWGARYPLIRAQFIYAELSLLAPQVNAQYSAVAWAEETLETTSSLAIRDYHPGALHQLALAEISVGMRDKADTHFDQYSRLVSSLPADDQRAQTLQMSVERAEAEAKLGLLNQAHARLESIREQAERVGHAVLKLRLNADLGQVRLRLGNYGESRKLLTRALETGESARSGLSETDSLSWTRLMGHTYRALVECEIRSGADPRQTWIKWSGYRAALSNQALPPNLAGDPVPPGQAMLSLAELPSGIGVWLYTPRGFHFQWLAPSARDAASRLVHNCTEAQSPLPVLRADARDLSAWLLGPWEKELDGVKTLIIESDGPVSSLPWPALVLSKGLYWSEEFATRIRVGAGSNLKPRVPVALAKRILAVGAPAVEANQDLPPLPDAMAEAKRVSAIFPRSILLTGREATMTEVRNRLENAEVFHFAGHGYGGAGGGLILRGAGGGPALLKAGDIQDLDLSRCRLAVLSGCSTGAGERNGSGDPAKPGACVSAGQNRRSRGQPLESELRGHPTSHGPVLYDNPLGCARGSVPACRGRCRSLAPRIRAPILLGGTSSV